MSSRSSLRFRRSRLGTKYPVPVFPHHGITHSVATYVPAILTVHRQPDPRRGDTTRHAIARWNSAQSHMTAVLGRGSRYQSGCFLRPSIEVFSSTTSPSCSSPFTKSSLFGTQCISGRHDHPSLAGTERHYSIHPLDR
ncbi:unnamed protein product [Mycena citricolor]|uniref:Uncharacterized protein n=1 Tax=Mycena citricolor TaxID=2018698 RepID=A0AAD2HPR9_9AGAR|nr:unnamed protein product [Mycena citricolor]